MGTSLDSAVGAGQVETVRHLLELGVAPTPDITRVQRGKRVPGSARSYNQILNATEAWWPGIGRREATAQVFRLRLHFRTGYA